MPQLCIPCFFLCLTTACFLWGRKSALLPVTVLFHVVTSSCFASAAPFCWLREWRWCSLWWAWQKRDRSVHTHTIATQSCQVAACFHIWLHSSVQREKKKVCSRGLSSIFWEGKTFIFEKRQWYCHVFIQNKTGQHSNTDQSSVPWICGFCNLAEECWLCWLTDWESRLYCFLRDTNTLALITIELCTQWLGGMLRFMCTGARDMLVSHTVTGSKRNRLLIGYKLKCIKKKRYINKCSVQWGTRGTDICVCLCVCVS